MALEEFDKFTIGKVVGPLEITVDERRVRDFVYATDDFNPWYISDSPFGAPITPVTLLTSDDPEFGALQEVGKEDALAARYEVRSFEALPIGEKVTLRTINIGKYIRRGKAYVVRQFDVVSVRTRRPFIESRLTEMVEADVGGEVRKDEGASAGEFNRVEARTQSGDPVSFARPDLKVGTPLPRLEKKVTRKQTFVFSARPGWWTSIHTDPEFAKSLGLKTAIAQGLMSTAYANQMCTSFFGESWFKTGTASLAFTKPVYIDDVLTVEACVACTSKDKDNNTRLDLELWCKNQNGELTAVGSAGASISR